MHIAIDISPLQSGHSGRGVGVYTKLLIGALQTYERDHTVSLITHQHDIPESCNVIHYPYFDPFFLTLPFFRKYPGVVTIHDMIPLLYPDKFPAGMKGNIRWQLQKLSLSGIKRIITDSNTSKKDICRVVGRDPSSVDVVYLAPSVNETLMNNGDTQLDAKKHFTGDNPYIMYVGDVNWNKNIVGLLNAFAVSRKTLPSLHLILVGKSFCNTHIDETKEIRACIDSLGIESVVRTPGYVEPKQLHALYREAVCLVQPSFYEGFGFPVVDALSLGCPVVASHTSSLLEISGPSIQSDPSDTDSIARGIVSIAQLSSQKRKKLIADGSAWVTRFTWKRVAAETIASYTKALV